MIARAAEKSANVAGLVVMVYSELSSCSRGSLADVAPTALSFVYPLVLLGCDAVGLTDVRGVVVPALLLLIQLVVRVASRPRIHSNSISRDAFRETVLAPLFLFRRLPSQSGQRLLPEPVRASLRLRGRTRS